MKLMNNRILFSVIIACCLPGFAMAQGSLTPPPGVPAPTMKTLNQVEPRIPLVAASAGVSVAPSGTITISAPGSYYLTGNLQVTSGNGITINANNVSVDLMGYTISCTTANILASAIAFPSYQNITIANGHISSNSQGGGGTPFTASGFGAGINGINAEGIRVSNITVGGVGYIGIELDRNRSTLVESCTVNGVGMGGITANIVRDSVVTSSGNAAFNSRGIFARIISNCDVEIRHGTALFAYTVEHSVGSSIGNPAVAGSQYIGINAGTVINSEGSSQVGDGVRGVVVKGSTGYSYGSGVNSVGILGTLIESSTGFALANDSGPGILTTSFDNTGTVLNSQGVSFGSNGIEAEQLVMNSIGVSTRNLGSANGIRCDYRIVGSTGRNTSGSSAGSGLYADMVESSYGESSGVHGIHAFFKVLASHGVNSGGAGFGIYLEGQGIVSQSRGSSAEVVGISALNGTVSESVGSSEGGMVAIAHGILARTIRGSYGSARSGRGLEGSLSVIDSEGYSSDNTGIFGGSIVANSYGETRSESATAHGIASSGTVTGSFGFANDQTGGGHGIHASGLGSRVSDSTGLSRFGSGIKASMVNQSYGYAYTAGLDGIDATFVTHSFGHRQSTVAGKFGIRATRAVGSYPVNGASIASRYDMP